MSARTDRLTAARSDRRAEVVSALAALETAALTTQTTATLDAAMSRVQAATRAFWAAGHIADNAARKGAGP
jgi:hypothetical protein